MSWLGGSLSSLTGQLSNLTKDILTEGTEEVSDHVTELRLAQERVKELDTVCVSQKIEIDRLKLLVREWEEKAEGSELQINSISREYRSLLEQKEKENQALKQQEHERQELKPSFISDQSHNPAVLRLSSDDGFENISYGGSDEHDFGDNIAMQHDINRLRGDVQRLQAECNHWKQRVQQQTKPEDDASFQDQDKGDNTELLKQLQDLQLQLSQEKDLRQQELSSLQDAQSHKMASLRKKHKQEVADLQQKIQELDWGSEGWESQPSSDVASLKQELSSVKQELSTLQEEREGHLQRISELTETLEKQKSDMEVTQAQSMHLENQLKVARTEIDRLLRDHDQVGLDLYDTKQQLLDQLDANHADTLDVLSDLRQVRQLMDRSAIDRRNKLLLEKDKIVNEMIDSSKKKQQTADSITSLEIEQQEVQAEAAALLEELGDKQHQTLTADIVDSLEKENLMLKKRNVSLQEQVALLEKAVQNVTREKHAATDRHTNGHTATDSDTLSAGDLDLSDATSMTSDLSEMSRRNQELDEQVIGLRSQIRKYETEIEQFELLQYDWLNEKEALEDVLMQLRGQMRDKENSLNVVEAQKGLLAVEKQEGSSMSALPDLVEPESKESFEDLAEEAVKLDNKIVALTDANACLEHERDTLTDANACLERERDTLTEANACLERERDNLEKEKESVQRELAVLKASSQAQAPQSSGKSEPTDLNMLLKDKEEELQVLISEKEDLQRNLAQVPDLKVKLQEKQVELENLLKFQAEVQEKDETESLEIEVEELKKRLRGKNEEIVNLSLEKEEMMTSLEELDNQHQEAIVHVIQIKDELAKSNEDMKKKLSSAETEIQGLKGEIDQLKHHNLVNQLVETDNSNELNHQIAELKENNSDLSKRLANSTDSIAKYENDNLEKDNKIKEMNEKLVSTAAVLNDLHMDKKELEENIVKYKENLKTHTEKIKQLKDENSQLKQESKLDFTIESGRGEPIHGTTSGDEGDQLEDKISTLTEQLRKSKEEISAKTEESVKHLADLKAMENSFEREKKRCEEMKVEVAEMETCLSQKEASLKEIQDELTSTKRDCAKLTKESDRKHEECESFSRQLHALENELHISKKENSENKTEIVSLKTELESLRTEITSVRTKLAERQTECESLVGEMIQVKDLLEDTTDKLHTKCEQSNELMQQVESHKLELYAAKEAMENEYNSQLLSATGELVLVKEELAIKTEEWEKLDKELYEKDDEINLLRKHQYNLETTIENIKSEKGELEQKCSEMETKLRECSDTITELELNRNSLKTENGQLLNEMAAMDQKMGAQAKQYETYIDELKTTKESDSSSLQSQFEEVLEKSHQKDLQITDLDTQVTSVQGQLHACKENLRTMTENYEKSQTQCSEKDMVAIELKDEMTAVKTENVALSGSCKENDSLITELRDAQNLLQSVNSEKVSLQEQIKKHTLENDRLVEESKIEKDKLDACIQQLNAEIQHLKEVDSDSVLRERDSLHDKIKSLENEVDKLKQTVIDQEAGITDLNQKKSETVASVAQDKAKMKSQDSVIEVLKLKGAEKDNEITMLQRKLKRAKSFIDEEQVNIVDSNLDSTTPNYDLPAIEYKERNDIEGKEVIETMVAVNQDNRLGMVVPNGDAISESRHGYDIISEIDRLRDQLSEKDNVISELQRNNSSLLKMLDSKSKLTQGDTSLVEMHKLENEVRALKMEREQMMDVLNDKSRESSNLKAEVQKLMNIIAAEKTALEKLQRDNHELTQLSLDKDGQRLDDMQKEVVQNLSRMIRDKDLEIESLTQKNETLISVLQESSNEGSQINTLMQDKDNLSKQLTALQSEREQMVAYLNQKHQESLTYHNEVQRLTAYINTENETIGKVKQDYEILVPQFEDKKQALLKAQNELINYKQKYTELEMKHGQLLQQCGSGDSVDKAVFDSKVLEVQRLQEKIQELSDSLKDKEVKIQTLHQNINELEQNLRTIDNERMGYKKQVDNFVFQLHGLQAEQGDHKAEISQLKHQNSEVMSECQTLREANNKLTLQLQDRDFEVKSLGERATSLTTLIQQQTGERGQMEHLMQENASTQNHLKMLQQERDQAVMAYQQGQEKNAQLTKQVHEMKEKEMKLHRELNRLKEHLLQVEDGYTREALAAEEREKDLRNRLATAEESALSSTSAVQTVNEQASQQLDSIKQQLYVVSQQRDQAYLQISTLQEQNQMYTGSLTNLQMVLEQFQQEKEQMVSQETEKYVQEISKLKSQSTKLEADLKYTREQLDEASDGLEAAARLSEQLDRKEEAIDALREEVQIREAALKVVEEDNHRLKSRNDDKVDKLVIKNLFLGYFSTPQNKRHEVLRAIGGVLLFTSEDFERIEGLGKSGWVPGFLKFGGGAKPPMTPPTSPARRSTIGAAVSRSTKDTFSEMFVRFLEKESSPPPPTVRLPAEEMARDVQKQVQKPAYNPFTAPRHVAMPLNIPGHTPGVSHDSQHSQHILMNTDATTVSHSLPTFAMPSESSRTPPGSGRNTPSSTSSGAILKDVLNR